MDTLSTRALCTLEDVKQYLNLESEVDQDDLLNRLINAASDAIYTFTDREFKVIGSNPQTRTFDAYDVYANGILYVGDFTALTSAVVKNSADEIVQTMDMDDVTYLPRNRKPWEPYNAVRLRDRTLYYDYYLELAGTWGFPSVPEDVRQACIVTVMTWYARDIAKFSGTFSIDQDRIELPRSLPPAAQDALDQYRVVPVG